MTVQTISATLLILVFIAIAIKIFAPMVFQVLCVKYAKERTKINGAKAARQMLKHAGITDVTVGVYPFDNTSGSANCYHSDIKALFLAPEVYHGHSIRDIAIACHEAGHAIQHKQNFKGILPFTFFVELDANKKALEWLRSDLARSVGGLNKWASQSKTLLRWSLLAYIF